MFFLIQYSMKRFSKKTHCTKSVHIRSYSGPYSVRMRENTDHNNTEYEHFSGSGKFSLILVSLGKDEPLKMILKYGLRDSQDDDQKCKLFLTNSFVLAHSSAKKIYNEQLTLKSTMVSHD